MNNISHDETINLIEKICKFNSIDCKEIKKADSGYTNIVFIVNNEFVIKVINSFTKPEKLQKEIEFYKNVKLDFIPQYIASGKIDDKDYLIIKKIEGKSLYVVWHSLSESERENVLKQIANILNNFHKLDGNFLLDKFKKLDWIKRWKDSFKLNIDILNRKGFETSFLQDFSDSRLEEIFSENKPCLIYNDAHFDNFIYNNGKVYLIDFDRVLYCSIDYEFLVIKMMVDDPTKFASDYTVQFVEPSDFSKIYATLEKYSPDMFNFKYINERVFIYKFIYHLGQGYETNNTKWIEKQLVDFKKMFY